MPASKREAETRGEVALAERRDLEVKVDAFERQKKAAADLVVVRVGRGDVLSRVLPEDGAPKASHREVRRDHPGERLSHRDADPPVRRDDSSDCNAVPCGSVCAHDAERESDVSTNGRIAPSASTR